MYVFLFPDIPFFLHLCHDSINEAAFIRYPNCYTTDSKGKKKGILETKIHTNNSHQQKHSMSSEIACSKHTILNTVIDITTGINLLHILNTPANCSFSIVTELQLSGRVLQSISEMCFDMLDLYILCSCFCFSLLFADSIMAFLEASMHHFSLFLSLIC